MELDNVLMEEMTWPEIREAVDAGVDRAVVVAGSIEQHGPHLPLATDTLYGYELGRRVARKVGRCLVAPVIRPGCSDHHLAFAGSLSISAEQLQGIIRSYCSNLAQHGFETIILLASHGGNFAPMQELVPELEGEYGARGIRIVAVLDLEGFVQAQNTPLADIPAGKAGSHAGFAETSGMLVVAPELVRSNRLEKGFTDKPDRQQLFEEGLDSLSHIGVLGDPRGASEERGEAIIESISSYLAEQVSKQLS